MYVYIYIYTYIHTYIYIYKKVLADSADATYPEIHTCKLYDMI